MNEMKCPFYKLKNKTKDIVCEGLIPGTHTTVYFSGSLADQKRDKYMREYCCSKYDECPMHTAIAQKYE